MCISVCVSVYVHVCMNVHLCINVSECVALYLCLFVYISVWPEYSGVNYHSSDIVSYFLCSKHRVLQECG